uniref:Phytanoyl-CoA dioxygenase n=1 Tax=Trieres chinensis TaxID=1514140 RepID=A0A7S1ZJE2_TRICV|mmetsp:Transcript_26802/g.54860  ORF Transcript_26802/g.54860 Transcript_26802/m.54860 type:complete len:406 (+) Transcript_26802:31-1248(+)
MDETVRSVVDASQARQSDASCAVIGILPPSKQLFQHVTAFLTNIEGKPLKWRPEYSLAEDEENGNKLTLLMSAIYVKPTTPEDIVEAVKNSLYAECKSPQNDSDVAESSAELWAASPAPFPLRPVGGYDPIINIDRVNWEKAAQVMNEFGIVTQKSILGPDEVSELRQLVDKAIADVEAALAKHHPEIEIGEDTFTFREIASRNLERFDLRLDSIPKAKEMVENYILSQTDVMTLLSGILGPSNEMDFDMSVVYSRPGAINQRWHSDGAHLNEAKDSGFDEDGWKNTPTGAYALCLFVPLIDLDEETGYTQFWPRSHRHSNLSGFGPAAELTKATFDGICNAGDGLWYDYRLLHRGMFNVSTVVRPVIQVIFKKKWYVERVNYGREPIVKDKEAVKTSGSIYKYG